MSRTSKPSGPGRSAGNAPWRGRVRCRAPSRDGLAPWLAVVATLAVLVSPARSQSGDDTDPPGSPPVRPPFADEAPPARSPPADDTRPEAPDPASPAAARAAPVATIGEDESTRAALAEADRLDASIEELLDSGRKDVALETSLRVLALRRDHLADEDLLVGLAFDRVTEVALETRRLDLAEETGRAAERILRARLDDDDPRLALVVMRRGVLAMLRSHFAEAEAPLIEALAMRRAGLPPGHPDIAQSADWLGQLHRHFGRFDDALALFEESLEIKRSHHGDDHDSVAASLVILAGLHRDRGEIDRAIELQREGIALGRPLLAQRSPWWLPQQLGELSMLVGAQGDVVAAEALAREAVELCRDAPGGAAPLAVCLNQWATRLAQMARLDEAWDAAREAVDVCHEVHGRGRHAQEAACLGVLAGVATDQGRLAAAEALYEEALSLARRFFATGHPEVAKMLNGLGRVRLAQARFPEARQVFEQALAILAAVHGAEHHDVARVRTNIGLLAYEEGLYAEARSHLRRALETHRRVEGDDGLTTAVALNHLMIVEISDPASVVDTEPLLRHALDVLVRRGGEDGGHALATRRNLAVVLAREGAVAEAVAEFRALDRVQRRVLGASHPATLRTTTQLAALLCAEGQGDEGLELLSQAATDFESTRLAASDTGLGRAEIAAEIGPHALLAARLAESGRGRDAWEALERGLARGLLDDVAAGGVLSSADVRARLADDAAIVAWLDVGRGALPFAAGELHWACVLRSRGDPTWVRIEGSGADGAWAPADDELLGEAARGLGRPASRETAELLERLRAQRLDPLDPLLAATDEQPAVEHLVVVAAGALARLPIEALSDRFTVSYAPSATMYVRLLERGAAPTGDGGRLLALGDIVSPGGTSPALRPLPGSRPEVETIADLVRGTADEDPDRATVLLGADANESRLRELARGGQLGSYSYVHVATHALVDDRFPMESALVLSRERDEARLAAALERAEPGDGRLTAAEILTNWSLDGALVTLSACETALGRDLGGEGIKGFAQALLVSGASSLVLSLWSVDDTATLLLMTRLYENLLGAGATARTVAGRSYPAGEPLPKALALRESKRWLRELTRDEVGEACSRLGVGSDVVARGGPALGAGEARRAAERPFADPYYWAAFVLVGDHR